MGSISGLRESDSVESPLATPSPRKFSFTSSISQLGLWIACGCSCVLLAGGIAYAHTPVALGSVTIAALLPLVVLAPDRVFELAVLTTPIGIWVFTTSDSEAIRPSSLRLPAIVACAALVMLRNRARLTQLKPALIVYSLLLSWLAIRTMNSPSTLEGLRYVAKAAVPVAVLFALIGLCQAKSRNVAAILLAIMLSASLIADYAMLAVGYHPSTEPTAYRFAGFAGAAVPTGFALSLLAVSALAYSVHSRSRVFLGLYVASLPIVLLTYSRLATAAWLFGSLAVLALAHARPVAYVPLLAGFVLVVASQTLASRSLPETSSGGWGVVIANVENHGVTAINTTGRTPVWSALWNSARHSVLIGNGTGASAIIVADVTGSSANGNYSDYLGLLVDGGAVALALWVSFLLLLGRALYRLGPTAKTAIGILFAYAILATTDSPITNYAQGGTLVGVGLAALISEEMLTARRNPVGRNA